MRLLDQPLQKQADEGYSNKEALIRALASGGVGAIAGGLGELLTRGSVSWAGPTIGAAMGLGTNTAVDPRMRATIRELWRRQTDAGLEPEKDSLQVQGGLEGWQQAILEYQKDRQRAMKTGKPTNLMRTYNQYKTLLKSGKLEGDDEAVAEMQDLVGRVDAWKKGRSRSASLLKDPRYADVMKYAQQGGKLEKVTQTLVPNSWRARKVPWQTDEQRKLMDEEFRVEDITLPTAIYFDRFADKFGREPEPWELQRFVEATRSGLGPEELEQYWQGRHKTSGQQLYTGTEALIDLSSGLTGFVPGIDKAMAKTLQKVPSKWVRGAGDEIATRVATTTARKAANKEIAQALGKRFLPGSAEKLQKILVEKVGPERAKALIAKRTAAEAAEKLANKPFTAQATKKLLKKLPGSRLAGRLIKSTPILRSIKGVTRAEPISGSVLDAIDLLRDEERGGWSWNVLRNARASERLMSQRERYEDMINPLALIPWLPDSWKQSTGERNMLYNIGAGGLEGAVSRWRTPLIAGLRAKDITQLKLENRKRNKAYKKLVGTDPTSWQARKNVMRATPGKTFTIGHKEQDIFKTKGLPYTRRFKVQDVYSPDEWYDMRVNLGFTPDGMGGWHKL